MHPLSSKGLDTIHALGAPTSPNAEKDRLRFELIPYGKGYSLAPPAGRAPKIAPKFGDKGYAQYAHPWLDLIRIPYGKGLVRLSVVSVL